MAGPFKFSYFTRNSIPDWCCPDCSRATLEIIPDSLKTHQTARARRQWGVDDNMGPEEDENVFSCLLICTHKSCQQTVIVSGDGYYEHDWSEDNLSTYSQIFRPRYFHPPLSLFTRCDTYPEKIKSQLLELSAQLPGHPQAAINVIRTTLEIVLDSFDIPRNKNGRYLSLDKRISLIQEPYKYIEAGFRAMKWLGNTGSHNLRPVSDEDIEGACNMLDDFLLRIYTPVTDHSETISRLNKNHAPVDKE